MKTLLILLLALVGLPGILCGFIAATKTLTVLAKPRTTRTFQ